MQPQPQQPSRQPPQPQPPLPGPPPQPQPPRRPRPLPRWCRGLQVPRPRRSWRRRGPRPLQARSLT
ncbi:MAG: hypothetical protein F4076_03130 [Acidimicrobiaceae bacterium]|nr:hypothetical protein [Acidimicrobiaceae bacterium]MYJ41430.1 hypothetical protein [Acidimicrobiaceae bacterium]